MEENIILTLVKSKNFSMRKKIHGYPSEKKKWEEILH